jgi:hypothetical protein
MKSYLETYKNDYAQNEDLALWELHEIRHKLHKELKGKTLAQINAEAHQKYVTWQQHRREHTGKLESSV